MKNSITYKAITVAIGILVAMVIALTLWIRNPDATAVTGINRKPQATVPVTVKKIIQGGLHLFTTRLPQQK